MYYVAVVCPAHIEEKVLQFKYWMKEQFNCIVALKSPAHITLLPPFWLEEAREPELQQTLQSFKSDINELEIQLEGFAHFGNKVLFINVNENPLLEELKCQMEEHFLQSFSAVIKKDDRPFHPHITIASRDMKPGDFEKAWQYFSKKQFIETFRIKMVSLLRLGKLDAHWYIISNRSC